MQTRKKRKRRRRHVRPGTPPGTIVVDQHSLPSTIDVFQFDSERIDCFKNITPEQIPPLKPGAVTWINVVGLGDKQVIEQLADRFEIHDLAAEDVVNTHQRPKVEEFADHLYIVLRIPTFNGSLELEQISIFVGQHYVLTWQETSGDCFDAIRDRIASPHRLIRRHGNDFLAYTLIDAIVDSYFPVLIQYGDALDEIEDRLTRPTAQYGVIHDLHHLRTNIRTLRRSVWSHRDAIRSLVAYEGALFSDETRLHLRDVADHTLQLAELLESSRDSCSDLQDLYMSAISIRMNEVMKVLTIIATIFIPLGFIAGLYGMNFSAQASPWNMPETQWYYGYPMALSIMAIVAVSMLAFFHRRGWINPKSSSGQEPEPENSP